MKKYQLAKQKIKEAVIKELKNGHKDVKKRNKHKQISVKEQIEKLSEKYGISRSTVYRWKLEIVGKKHKKVA